MSRKNDQKRNASSAFIARANNPFGIGTDSSNTKTNTKTNTASSLPHGTGHVSTRIRFRNGGINGTLDVARKINKVRKSQPGRNSARPIYRSTREIVDEIDRELQATEVPVHRKPGRPRKSSGVSDPNRTPGMSKPVQLARLRTYARIVRTALKDVPAASKLSSIVKQRLVQGLVDEMCFALESLAKEEVLVYGARGPKPRLLQIYLLAGVNHQFHKVGINLKEWVGGRSNPTELTDFCEDLLKGMKIKGHFFSSRQVQVSRKFQIHSMP